MPGCQGKKVTDEVSGPRRGGVSEDRKELPEWLVRELLRQNKRRHTVTLGDAAQIMTRQHHSIDSARTLCSLKVQLSNHLSESGIREVKCDLFEPFSASENVF